jgi:hypothetical protein
MSSPFEVWLKGLLNDHIIVRYMYNKPCLKKDNFKALCIDYDDIIQNVNCDENIIANVEFLLVAQLELIKQKNTKGFDATHRSITIKREIFKYLVDISKGKYSMSFIFGVKMHTEGLRKSIYQPNPVHLHWPFYLDYLGFIVANGNLRIFAIMIDSKINTDKTSPIFKSIHKKDIFMQYVLYQCNIHLLRITKNHNFKTEIKKFFKRMSNSNNYISINPIKPYKKILSDRISNDINKFNNDYINNKKIYVKLKPQIIVTKVKKKHKNNNIITTDIPDEGTSTIVEKDFVNSLISNSMYDIPIPVKITKESRADRMMKDMGL